MVPEFVGRADALHLSATLLRARDNAPLARARVSGSENSIDSLTSVLLARLWAAADGELPERVGSISASLPALKAYLRGKGALRAGRHADALADFRVALEHDSTFALAALAYTEGAWLTAGIPRDFQFTAQEIAWERREQLNERDREYLGLLLRAWGERSQLNRLGEPLPFQTRGEALTAITRAAASGPERPELHFLLGDELYHFGQAMGESDPYGRADAAFRRAMALDTALPPQIYVHRGYLAAQRGDTTALRRIFELHQARLQRRSITLEWLLHFNNGDRPPLHEDSLGLDPGENSALTSLYQITLHFGSDPGPVRRGLARARRGASPQLSIQLPSLEWQLAVNTGRPVDAASARSRAGADTPVFALAEALFDDLPPSERARLKTEAQASAKSRPPELPESRAAWYRALCLSTLMEAAHGDVAAVPAAASRLATALSDDGLLFPVVIGGCASVARLLAEARTHPERVLPVADSVEAFLRAAPAGDVLLRHVFNLLVAPVFEHNLNDVRRALAAVRRAETPVITLGYSLLAWKLREEGRLAAASGDRTGAIQAYRRYLILRSDAEPPLRKRDDDIRAELARLTTLDRS